MSYFKPLFALLVTVSLCSCLVEVVAPPPPNAVSVLPSFETSPVAGNGDAADDPAIWLNFGDVSKSLVLGTDKGVGIEVYNLEGQRVQAIRAGRTNNIDLRYLENNSYWSAIAAASNRTANTVSLFTISHEGEVHWLQDSEIDTGLTEPYGLCMFRNDDGYQVFVNDTDGSYQQWKLVDEANFNSAEPRVSATLLREFSVPSQPEGCVADDDNERLFLGVEAEGVRVIDARASAPIQFVTVADIDGVVLVADVEGMSLYKSGNEGYLVVSSQGNYSYSVYDRLPPHSYLGSFIVVDNETARVDGSQETDGLAISSQLVTPDFPRGLLVVQDGYNTLPVEQQNFKYISWEKVETALGL